MNSANLVLDDWKREGAFIGVEYRLQLGAYFGCPYVFEKETGRFEKKPPVEVGCVSWVGAGGVKTKLTLSRAELEQAFAEFQKCVDIYQYLRAHDDFIAKEESRYTNPMNPSQGLVSVTQVLKHVIAKPGLMNWYYEGGMEAGLALRHRGHASPEVCEAALGVKDQLNDKVLKKSDEAAKPWGDILALATEHELTPTVRRDAAGTQGSTIHKNVMFYLRGKPVELSQAPQWLVETMTKFVMWSQKVKLMPKLVETTVFHPDLGYAGTLDCLGSRMVATREESNGTD